MCFPRDEFGSLASGAEGAEEGYFSRFFHPVRGSIGGRGRDRLALGRERGGRERAGEGFFARPLDPPSIPELYCCP